MRRYNISPSSCPHIYTTPCCADCEDTGCASRCLNSPKWCNCWSDKPPRQKRERKVSSLTVVWLYEKGLTQVQIAERLECNRKTVAAILREMGVTSHGKS